MATADQQFCLRWNNHQSTLISVFDTLLENGTLVDCTLAAEGQSLKAHKVVLSACSPYLEALLSQHYEKHPIVIMKDVKFSELKSMMDYMYRGEVNISQDQLGTFLKAAESLQIKGLSDNGDDARDVGSTASKRQDASRPSVTQTRAPVESKRPASTVDSDASRDGSISPSSLRKRRRTRRPSHGDDPDSHLDANACDLPNAQSTPMPVSVPNTSIVPTSIQNLPKQIVKQEPTSISTLPETGLKKEIMDPPTEPLLEPKTEYLDYMNNENSIEVEDLTLDDDDELDSSMDASRPGPSHGDMSNQGYPAWPMTDQSGTDEIFMAAQEAVGAATAQRDSQGRNSKQKGLQKNSRKINKKSPLKAVSKSRGLKDSSEQFYGFTSEDCNQAARSLSITTEVMKNSSLPPEPSSAVRARQPRVSKSRASLAWQKGDKFFDTVIKEEPLDDVSPTKSARPLFTVGEVTVTRVKKEPGVEVTKIKKKIPLKASVSKFVIPNESVTKASKQKTSEKQVARKGLSSKAQKILSSSRQKVTLKKIKPVKVKDEVDGGCKTITTATMVNGVNGESEPSTSAGTSSGQNHHIDVMRKRKMKKKSHKNGFKCDQCGRAYKYIRGLRQHKKLECNVEPQFPCPYCPKRFRYRQGIREHVRNYHEKAFPKWYAMHYVKPVFDNLNSLTYESPI